MIKKKIFNTFGDILDYRKLNLAIKKAQPQILFHLAAQPLVSESFIKPKITINTNVNGTLNVLESIREIKSIKSVVIITSDKCYQNNEIKRGYRETDRLGGDDPYSASKAAAEIIFNAYLKSNFFNLKKLGIATARAGNVIGGGDWSKDRLIPDCMRSWVKKKSVKIRNPNSTRPWQHIFDVINGYLTLAVKLKKNKKLHGEAFNFGPNMSKNYKVREILKKSKKIWPSIKWKISKEKNFKENFLLNLNNTKAKKVIKWRPILDINKSIKLTIEWYKYYSSSNKKKIITKSLDQIKDFEKILNKV